MNGNTFTHVLVVTTRDGYQVRPQDIVGSKAIQGHDYLQELARFLHNEEDAKALALLIEEEIQRSMS